MEISLENISIICSISCLGAVIILSVLNFFKNSDMTKRLRRFERGFEDINKEVYKIKKWIKDTELESEYNNNAIHTKIKTEVKDALNNGIINVQRQIEVLESQTLKQNDYVEEKMLQLEEKLRGLNYTPSNGNAIDEKKIIGLFRDGWSVDAIAKEMRLNKGEIEFILKLSNIR